MRVDERTVKFEDVEVLRATDRALLCVIDGAEHWIPQSQIHANSEVYDDGENARGKLIISEWLAEQRGLI